VQIGCFCLSEPNAGSDAFALTTKAEDKGDHWLINGQKLWITNSGEAGIFLVRRCCASSAVFIVSLTDVWMQCPRCSPRLTPPLGTKASLALLLMVTRRAWRSERRRTRFVPHGTCAVHGSHVRELTLCASVSWPPQLGIRASSTCPVTFTDVRVPKEDVVGELGKGYKIAIEILNEGRVGIGAQMLGLAQGAFDATMPYLFERKAFGSAIGDFQGMQHQYAQVAVDIEAARMLVYNAARLKEAGRPFVKEAAMAKLYASQVCVACHAVVHESLVAPRLCDPGPCVDLPNVLLCLPCGMDVQVAERTASLCVEWMGGVGFTKDLGVEKFYRDCKIGAIYEGTSNIQKQTIAKMLSTEYRS